MPSVKEVLSAVLQFLKESQDLGIVEEFAIPQINSEVSWTPEFEKIFHEFQQRISSDVSEFSSKEEQTAKLQTESDIVQIQINKNEMQRRITAFKSWKRKEVEECNVQEFCSHPYLQEHDPLWDQFESCSRVDTVFMPRFGSKGHYKVSKVENRYGPNVQAKIDASKRIKREPESDQVSSLNDVSLETIQERLQSMESHLKLKTESSLRCSIIQRLRKLEDRILFLEGISPDYLHYARPNLTSPQKKSDAEKEKMLSNLNVYDIQKRIQTIKETLKCKSLQLRRESSE